jgi:DNA-binding transcriptional ArsR family regulator
MKVENLDEVVGVCNMLGDNTRASIIAALAKREKSVGDLCGELELPQPGISYHLGLLRATKVVTRKRTGKQMLYSLDRATLKPLEKFLAALRQLVDGLSAPATKD